MPKYVVDPDSQYKKGTVGDKRVNLRDPIDLTKEEVKKLEEVGVTVVEAQKDTTTAGNTTSTNN